MDDLLAEWHPPLLITISCVLALLVYLAGFRQLRRTRPDFPAWRAWCFAGGMAVLWISLASPLEELSDTLLTAHMVEHLLLMVAVPPLVLVGWPTVPLLRGLPTPLRRWTLAPLLRSRSLRRLEHFLVAPVFAWLAMNLTLLLWHIPSAYDYALEHENIHDLEHVCFLASSLLFWWVLLRPWPSRAKPLGWYAVPFLITADFVNTLLSALLAFAGRPVYTFYLQHPNGLGIDPLMDQTVGASIMWVFGSVAFLVPAIVLLARQLQGRSAVEDADLDDRVLPLQSDEEAA